VSAETSALSAKPAPPDDDADYLQAPGGHGRIHKSCVHEVPKGARVAPNGDVFVANRKVETIPPCQHPSRPAKSAARNGQTEPTVNGWLEWDWQSATTNGYGFNWFNGLGTEMLIEDYSPTTPNNGQQIFIFPSLEPTNAASIIQPVLQWGDTSCGGGGKYWSMANFYVYCPTTDPNYPNCSSFTCVHDTAIAVNHGDTINAYLAVDWEDPGCDSTGHNCNWRIGWVDEDTWDANVMNVSPPDAFTKAQSAVLEVYGVSHCTDLPTQYSGTPAGGIVDFINNALYQPGPNYNQENSVTVSPSGSIASGVSPSCGYWMWAGDATDIELGWNAGQ
jgi:hypothetical protein